MFLAVIRRSHQYYCYWTRVSLLAFLFEHEYLVQVFGGEKFQLSTSFSRRANYHILVTVRDVLDLGNFFHRVGDLAHERSTFDVKFFEVDIEDGAFLCSNKSFLVLCVHSDGNYTASVDFIYLHFGTASR